MDCTLKILLVIMLGLGVISELRQWVAPAEAQSGGCGYQKSRPCYYQIVTGT